MSRTIEELSAEVQAKNAQLTATEKPIDTSTAAGRCLLDRMGVFAEFEINLRRERQMESIAKARAAGVYEGRSKSIEGEHEDERSRYYRDCQEDGHR